MLPIWSGGFLEEALIPAILVFIAWSVLWVEEDEYDKKWKSILSEFASFLVWCAPIAVLWSSRFFPEHSNAAFTDAAIIKIAIVWFIIGFIPLTFLRRKLLTEEKRWY